MNRPDVIEKLHEVAKSLPSTMSVWVYGSEARGEARADSDIDLLLLNEGERLSVLEQQDIFRLFFPIELATGVQINLHFDTKAGWDSRSLHSILPNKGEAHKKHHIVTNVC